MAEDDSFIRIPTGGKPESVLSVMYKSILFELGITPTKFNRLLDQYIRRYCDAKNAKEVSSERGNIRKELLGRTLSWKGFMKGFYLLNAKRFTIIIEITHASNKTTTHRRVIELDDNPTGDDDG